MTGVLVVGDIINDVVVIPVGATAVDSDTKAQITAVAGGSGANQAAWLAALGVPVRLAAAVGAGDADRQRSLLAGHGVDPRLGVDPERATGSIVVVVGEGGTRSMYTDRGANAHLGNLVLTSPEILDGIAHLHVSGYTLIEPATRAAVTDLWRAAGGSRLTRSVDVGSAAFLREIGPAFVDLMEGADVVFANLSEGRLVTGLDDAASSDDVVACLLDHFPLVVLKLGADGAIIASRSLRMACPPAGGAVVDPTGSGDAFCAGFLARWLDHAGFAEAAASATHAAARAMAIVGGRPPQEPSPSESPTPAPAQAPAPAPTPGTAPAPTPAPAPAPGTSSAEPQWEALRRAALSASASAYAPYSNLRVGAAGIDDDGQLFTGCNVENASFGLTLCAECGLVSALRIAGAQRLVAVSVVGDDGRPLAPCGRCRQVLMDNGGPSLLIDQGPGTGPVQLRDLLPGAFGADDLPEPRST